MTLNEINTLSEKYKIISITADFINSLYDSVQSKHLDNARHIICTLTENGIPRPVGSDETARVRIQKPDKTYVYNDCDVIDDGRVLITLTEQILAYPGTASCDIQLTSYDGVIYSTKKFYIIIDDTPYPPDAIESSNEFNALNKIIAQEKEHIDLIKELDNTLTTNESVRQANEDTRKNNEDIREHNEDVRLSSERNRVDAENLRVNNETTRIKAENTRINSEDTRHDNENTRISNENERISTEIIRNTTEISRNNNETKRVSSENERLKKEDARISAETNRVTNESIRIANEEKRIDSETKRQSDHSILQNQFDTAISNTNIATDNAKKATTDAKKATQLAENATDLALEAAANANDTYAYSTKYTDEKISNLVNGAPETLDTLKEVADAIAENETVVKALDSAIGTKANQSVLDNHTNNSNIHITSAERTSWNSKASGTHTHNYAGSSSAGGAATTSLACTGNAATATKLATARTINDVSFDGSTNVTIADNTKLPLTGGTVTGRTHFTQGNSVYWLANGKGTTGHMYACQIKIIGAYANQPLVFRIVQRGRCGKIRLMFSSVNGTDPSISSFTQKGVFGYIYKESTSTWNLYIAKTEAYDDIEITQLERGTYANSNIDITWKNKTISTLPDGSISATNYNLGSTTSYGHVKTVNALTQSSYVSGESLSAYQGYLLQQNKVSTITIPTSSSNITITGKAFVTTYANTYYFRFYDNIIISGYATYGYGSPPHQQKIFGGSGTSSTTASSVGTSVIVNSSHLPSLVYFSSGTFNSSTFVLNCTIYGGLSGSFVTLQYCPDLTTITYT